MLWWFIILACSTGAVVWAAAATYLRVRRHMKLPASAINKGAVGPEADHL
jgi:hypothetical protein